MTLVVRFLAAAATAEARASIFPADVALDDAGRTAASALRRGAFTAGGGERVVTSPAASARETASLLGWKAEFDPDLRDLDYGEWASLSLSAAFARDPAVAAAWVHDAAAAPPGGESIVALLARARAWLERHAGERGRLIAVTHPAVIRAAVVCTLAAPPLAFWSVDIEPLHLTQLTWDGRRWSLRCLNRPLPPVR